MGLLAPLYMLGALAVAGPIIFHLIRRQPQGQTQFSSLMFLSPSPPRLTRRSRLDNLFLLLLRIAAIVLIAVAFSRPYYRQESFLTAGLGGRNIVAVVDTSASMQRADVWEKAIEGVTGLLESLSPNDRVALYTLDRELGMVVPLEQEAGFEPLASQQAVAAALTELRPSWLRTRLAEGLKNVADMISAAAIAGRVDPTASNEIVLFTDLHTESELESLQGYPWPEDIGLDVRQLLPDVRGNARPSLMLAEQGEDGNDPVESGVRVRVENTADASEQSFRLAWANGEQPLSETETRVQIPAGQVRVVPLVARPSVADRVVLLGDAWQADNAVYVIEPERSIERIAFVGSEQSRPEEDLAYFLRQAPLDTDLVRREVFRADVQGLSALVSEKETRAIVLEPTESLPGSEELLRRFAVGGGVVLVCLSRPSQDVGRDTQFLQRLFDSPAIELEEAPTRDFALLSNIDFRHPVFAPFADPRFNDFSKVRFWNHRVVRISDQESTATDPWRVVASFDDASPMLLHQAVGKGNLWLLTCGWQPTGSGLALSSKFVPILSRLLDPSGRSRASQLTYEVGEPIATDVFGDLTIRDAGGSVVEDSKWIRRQGYTELLEPGLYRFEGSDVQQEIAIQIPASESRVMPLDSDVFEQYGVRLGKLDSDDDRREALRQLQVEELESKQRMWQWLIAVGMAVLAAETLIAGWLARRNAKLLAVG